MTSSKRRPLMVTGGFPLPVIWKKCSYHDVSWQMWLFELTLLSSVQIAVDDVLFRKRIIPL